MNATTLSSNPPHSRPFIADNYTSAMVPDPPRISFWDASPHLQRFCRRKLSEAAWAWAEPQFRSMGERAALEVAPLSMIADRESPRLVEGRVVYHPSYREMQRIAYGSGIIAMKYNSALSTHHSSLISFALGYLFAMAEMSLYCPLC